MERLTAGQIEWASACRMHPGETVSGDVCWIDETPGVVRMAVSDGLGHGPEAEAASIQAVAALAASKSDDVATVLRECHAQIGETRGVALSMARLDGQSLTWAGVGNVACLLARCMERAWVAAEVLVTARGVLGKRLPAMVTRTVSLRPGDVLVMATDGVREGFQHELPPLDNLQRGADEILRRHGTGSDDGLVVLLRWKQASPTACNPEAGPDASAAPVD